MTDTCLFTGVELGPNTKGEHTIPRAVGGRIVSRRVSSSDFNQACGSFCDDALRSAYSLLMAKLAPLLPRASHPGLVDALAPLEPQKLVIKPGGILARRQVIVTERDPAGRPKTVVGPDEGTLREFAKQAKMPSDAKITLQPLTPDGVVTTHLHVISPPLELAALKSVLLSFDCLAQQRKESFTRSQSLEGVRRFVRTSIEQQEVACDLLGKYSLGIQIEKLGLYAKLRDSMDIERSPFEHYMIVAGNRPQRCIDATWVVFGFEPFGFRLCDWYEGPDFCYALVNPIVKGQPASGLVELLPPDELLCCRTNRRSYQPSSGEPDDPASVLALARQMASEIAAGRVEAFNEAVYTVHTIDACEGWLVERLRELQKERCFTHMSELVEERLSSLYSLKEPTGELTTMVGNIVRRFASEPGARPDMIGETVADVESKNLWSGWMQVLRCSLTSLVESYGLPGSGFYRDVDIHADIGAWKKLGVV